MTDDSKFFACHDAENAVCLFRRDENTLEWKLSSKIIAHEIQVNAICFGEGIDDKGETVYRLFSVGQDRRVFEYDVYGGLAAKNEPLGVKCNFKVESEALPSCCLWYPEREAKEGLLLTTNDQYKMKVWNPSA